MKPNKKSLTDSSRLHQNADDFLKTKSLEFISQYSEIEFLAILDELNVQQIKTDLKPDELLATKSILQETVSKYINIFNSTSIAYLVLTKQGDILTLNENAALLLGKQRSYLINSQFAFFVSNDSKPDYNLFITNVFNNKIKENCEIQLNPNLNLPVEVEITAAVFNNGELCLMTIFEINKEISKISNLKNDNDKFRSLSDANIGLVIATADGKFIESNNYYLNLVGYSREEFEAGMINWQNLTPPEWLYADEKALSELREKGNSEPYEKEYLLRDGKRVFVSITSSLLYDNNELILGLIQDISKSKQLEKELQESNNKFNLAMDASNDGLWDWDVITGKVYYSPGYFKILGYEANELENTIAVWQNLLHPDDRQKAIAFNDACINNSIEDFHIEFRLKAKDNSWRWILSRGKAVARDAKGIALRMIGTHMDITDSKLSELALTQSENKYRELVENSPDTIVIYEEGKIVYVNKQSLNLMAVKNKDELLGKSIMGFVHPDYYEDVLERMKKIANEGGVLPLFNVKFIIPNGKIVDIEVKASSIKHENKTATQLIIRDISERIAAEKAIIIAKEKLIESEKRFSLFMDYLPAGAIIKDNENNLIYANKNILNSLGISDWKGLKTQTILKNRMATKIFADDKTALLQGYAKIEESFIHNDGIMHHYETQKFLLSTNNKAPLIGILAVDVSERKNYEIALKESRDKYWELIELAVDGILIGSIDGYIIEANTYICKLLKRKKSDIIGRHITDSIFTLESVEKTPFQFEKLKNGETVISERNILQPNATEITIEMRTKMMPDGSYQSIIRDITQRKRMELELMQLNENLENRVVERTAELLKSNIKITNISDNYKHFFNTIDDLLFVVDKKGKIKHVNSTVLERLGYKYNELIDMSIIILYPGEYIKEAAQMIVAMIAGETESCSLPIKTKSDDIIYVETKVKNGIWNNQNIFFVVCKDITNIKLSEEKFSKIFYLNPSAAGISDIVTGVYYEVNDAFCELFGFQMKEVIGKTVIELGIMQEEARAEIFSKADASGKMTNVATELKTKNGKKINALLSSEIIYLQDKKIRYTIVHDITFQKDVEEYSKRKFYYTHAINRLAEIIISIDNAQEILENLNRIIGETLQIDKGLIYEISFEKNSIINKCEWINHDFNDIESDVKKFNPIEIYSKSLIEIKKTRKYLESHFNKVNKRLIVDGSANILHKLLNIKSLLWFPFSFNEYGYYLLTLYQFREKKHWTQDEIDFLEAVSKHISLALIKIQLSDKRKEAEAQLLANNKRFRTVADYTYNWEYWQDVDDNYLYISPSCKRISGYSNSEFLQNPGLIFKIIYPDDLILYQYFTNKSNMIKNDSNEFDYRIVCADKKIKWVSQVSNFIYDESGSYIGIRGSISDVTEKTLVKQLLKASEEKYRLISENITEGLFICSNGYFQYTNNAMCQIFGYCDNDFDGMNISDLVLPEYREELDSFIKLNNYADKILKLELECEKKDKTIIYAEIQLNFYFYQKLVFGVVHNISERKQNQKNIFQAIVRTEENERSFFSKELHDGLGPLLSTIKLYMQWSERSKNRKSQQEAILKAEEILEEALTTVKEISNKMSPHLLTYYGINSALQGFIDKQKETSSLNIVFQSNIRNRFNKDIEVAIYRVVIECINNTIKHAAAKNISIKIYDTDSQLQIKYKDDGIGFDFTKTLALKKGLGLYNIQTRIQSIGGKVTMYSKPGEGIKYLFVVGLNN